MISCQFVFAGMKTNVYEQELTSGKFLYQSDLPTLTSLTVCFWLKLINNGNGYYPIIFSVATPGWWYLSYPHFDKSTLCLLEMLPSDVFIGGEVSIIKTRVQRDEFKSGYLEKRLSVITYIYLYIDCWICLNVPIRRYSGTVSYCTALPKIMLPH